MEYKKIGKSELEVSQVGFGCMSLLKASQQEAKEMVEIAIDAGINFFDTADLYDKGANEQLIGTLLKPVRKKVVLATKVGNQWREDGSGWDWNPSKEYIIKSVEDSLRRLQTDYIDLYQLHGGTIDDPIEETIEAFELLVQMGKIRYYGISSIRPNVIRKYAELSKIDSVMMQYSLLDRRPEEEMLTLLRENKISVLARGALAQGLLINKPVREYLGYHPEEVDKLQKELATYNNQNTALALHFVLNNPSIASAVIGFRTRGQLTDILKAYATTPDGEMLSEINGILAPKFYTEHRE